MGHNIGDAASSSDIEAHLRRAPWSFAYTSGRAEDEAPPDDQPTTGDIPGEGKAVKSIDVRLGPVISSSVIEAQRCRRVTVGTMGTSCNSGVGCVMCGDKTGRC